MADAKVTNTVYDEEFFKLQKGFSGKHIAANVISKMVIDLLDGVDSLVDLGCGLGIWPNAFLEHGVSTVIGVDGEYVQRDLMVLPESHFTFHDLTQPFKLDRKFDLASSLEVAEHLPRDRAEGFVEDLTDLAPVVLFSAAIPGQGGTHHVNEQWQDYWAKLFAARGYRAIDVIRPAVWSMPKLQQCYKQNTLIYASDAAIEANPKLAAARAVTYDDQLDLVHPLFWRRTMDRMRDMRLSVAAMRSGTGTPDQGE
jgi:SAM-dependent methyltransferase